jgi:hypothetical protein
VHERELLHLQIEVEMSQRQPSTLRTASEIKRAPPRLGMKLDDLYAIAHTEQVHLDVFVPCSSAGQLHYPIIDPEAPMRLWLLERTGQLEIKMQRASTLRHDRDERFKSLYVDVGSLELYGQRLTCIQARLTRHMQQLMLLVTPAQVHAHDRVIDPYLTLHLSHVVLLPAEGGQVPPTLTL